MRQKNEQQRAKVYRHNENAKTNPPVNLDRQTDSDIGAESKSRRKMKLPH